MAVSLAAVVREAVFLLLLYAVVTQHRSILAVSVCFLVAEIVWSALTQLLVARKPSPGSRVVALQTLLRQGWPIAIMGAMSLTYSKIDTPLLALMKGPGTAGVYYASYTLLFAAMGFAALVSKSALPELSKVGRQDSAAVRPGAERLAVLAALAGGGAAVALSGGAVVALRLIYGPDYALGSDALRILALSLPMNFASGILLNGLVASGHRRAIAVGSVVAAVANVGLNLILIPEWGMVGAAWATVASESALVVAGIVGHYGVTGALSLAVKLGSVIALATATAYLAPLLFRIDGIALAALNVCLYSIIALPIMWPHLGISLRARATHA